MNLLVFTESYEVFHLPLGEGCWTWIEWLVGWPARFVLTVTIPDCRREKMRKFYPLTFIMCIVYIALTTYVVSWMMTVIGKIHKIFWNIIMIILFRLVLM